MKFDHNHKPNRENLSSETAAMMDKVFYHRRNGFLNVQFDNEGKRDEWSFADIKQRDRFIRKLKREKADFAISFIDNGIKIGDYFEEKLERNWTAEDGSKGCQRDLYLCVVTEIDTAGINFKVVRRLSTIDTAPAKYDNGGITGGGIAHFAIPKYLADGKMKWVEAVQS